MKTFQISNALDINYFEDELLSIKQVGIPL